MNGYRRSRRKATLRLALYLVIMIVIMRLVADFFLAQVPELAHLRPYLLPLLAATAMIGWVSGILMIFHADSIDLRRRS